MTGNFEDLSFDQQVERLDEMAVEFEKIVDANGPMSTGQALKEASRNLGIAESQAKFGLNYAQSSGRIGRDKGTWTLRSA